MARRRLLRERDELKENLLSDNADVPDGFTDEQFEERQSKVPCRVVFYILALLICGLGCWLAAAVIYTGSETNTDRILPLMILGTITIVPGGYYAYMLLCVWLKRDGYTLDKIPIC